MILPQPLQPRWRRRCERYGFERNLTINERGAVFGRTCLAKFENDSLIVKEARLLALLSIACGYAVAASCIHHIRRAEKCYKRSEIALAQMELALTGIPGMDSVEQAQRLFMAEWLMNRGDPPHAVLKYAGIVKYNPYHLGAGPGGGQFTMADRDGTSNGLPRGAGMPDRSMTLKPSAPRMGETRVAADNNIISDSDNPFPGPNIPPTTVYLPTFPTAEMAEAVTGSYNWIQDLFREGNNQHVSTEIDTIVSKANQTVGNDGITASNKKAAYDAAEQFIGNYTRPIYDYNGNIVGKITLDGTKVVRYTSVNSTDPYINLENKVTNGNLHLRWQK